VKHAILALTASSLLAGCAQGGSDSVALQTKVDSLQAELDRYTAEEALTEMRIARFDSLDFDVYSNQKWDEFQISHADDIRVVYPDGSVTVGLDPQHLDALRPMFVFAPDTKIKIHPVKFGNGDWTAVIGEMEGTFSQPMPVGDGRTIPPTGRSFKLAMATIGHWKEGKMIEEYLFWDNQAFMQQIGLTD
jgi:predicted ester cyclase